MATVSLWAALNISVAADHQPDVCADSGYIPSSVEFFEDLTLTESVLVWICCVLALLTLAVYIENVHYVLRLHQSDWLDRRGSIWILSVMPLTSLCSAMTLCLPRAAAVPDLIASIAFALGVLHFKMEVMDHFGGIDMIVKTLQPVKIPLSSPPFCYFRSCCPSFYLTRSRYRLVSGCVLQTVVLQPLTSLVSVVIFMEDNYRYREMSTRAPSFYFILVRCASTLLGTYGLSLVVAATEPVWKPLDIAPKHLILKTWLGLFNIQGLIFSLLVLHDIPPCTGRLSSRVRGKAIMSVVLVMEILVVAVLTRRFYGHSDVALLEHHQRKGQKLHLMSQVENGALTDERKCKQKNTCLTPDTSDCACALNNSSMTLAHADERRASVDQINNYGAIPSRDEDQIWRDRNGILDKRQPEKCSQYPRVDNG